MRRTLDNHHLLYQKRHWNKGWAQLLRNHWYMQKMIPMETLHREIHSKIHDIPTPNGKECRIAYEKLEELDAAGMLSDYDPIEKRLDILIDLWKEGCPATVAILEWQKQVVAKFYERKH